METIRMVKVRVSNIKDTLSILKDLGANIEYCHSNNCIYIVEREYRKLTAILEEVGLDIGIVNVTYINV